MFPQFFHDGIDGVHITRVDFLSGCIALWKVLHELIHRRLVIAYSRRNGVYDFPADRLHRIRGRHGDKLWDDVEDDDLLEIVSRLP